jgi:hypothetical protein
MKCWETDSSSSSAFSGDQGKQIFHLGPLMGVPRFQWNCRAPNHLAIQIHLAQFPLGVSLVLARDKQAFHHLPIPSLN